jgi:hypothetical protein
VASVLSSGSAIFCISCNIFHPRTLVNAFRKPCQLLSAEVFPVMGALESLAGEIACSRIT